MRLWILASFCLLLGCLAGNFDFIGDTMTPGHAEARSDASTLCQGNCYGISIPTCDKNSAKRHVGYFDASNIRRRACERIWPGRLNTTGFTHITFGFAVFDPKTFAVAMEHSDDGEVYRQFLRLSEDVHKRLAIGGWNMSNEGPTRTAWSDMASTKANRKAFIDSLKLFLETWKFSGVELHWKWPGASNRGGNSADTQNQIDLIHELRECLGKNVGISVVLPTQYEYLKNMDLRKMQDAVDWFTILTYDLHGPWDVLVPDLGPKIKPHTDLAEIDTALNLLWAAELDPTKVNMGIANYGRGFTVADPSCKYYGCKFTGPSKAGTCTREDGLLSACEIRRIIREKKLKSQIIQGGAGVKEISWDDQWIGYDDDETLGLKLELANKRCIGGTSLWSLDYNHCDAHVSVPSISGPAIPVSSSLAPPSSESPAQPTPVSPNTSVQVSVVPQLPNSSSSQNHPSQAFSGPVSAPPSDAPVSVSSVQGSPATSSVVLNTSPMPGSAIPSSAQGSIPPLPLLTNVQFSSQTQPRSVGWTATALPSPGSSGSPSSRFPSGQHSSVARSSSSTSGVPVSATGLSTTSGLIVPIIPGFTSSLIQSFITPSSNAGSSANPTSLLTSATPSSVQSSFTIGGSSAQLSSPPGSSAGSSATVVVPIIPNVPSLASSTVTSRNRSSTPDPSTTIGNLSTGSSITVVVPIVPTFPSQASSKTTSNTQSNSETRPTNPGSSSTAVANSSTSPSTGSSQALSSLLPPSGSLTTQLPPNSGATLQSSNTAVVSSKPTSVPGVGVPTPASPISKSASLPTPDGPIFTSLSLPTAASLTFGSSSLPSVASLVLSSTKPSPTATGCPSECRNLDWCVIFCAGWKFPRPDYVQPPLECLLPENTGWCRTWWWGVLPDKEHNGGDPDSHSDSDPECKPNDCVSECVKWRIATFFIFKRPVCPCVPKKCDKNGESDSPSDSDRDDPKVVPVPTSRPKEKKPECKLFGCGCGWMGIGFGPGCPGLEFVILTPCGLFGCNPCIFFGCPGTQPEGIIGYNGHCPGGGCEPCPPELCSRPGCTIPGGCGPKPGPAPTKPPNRLDPEACDDTKRTLITERFVWCTEGFNVSALPSSLQGTSSTMISSICIPMIDATVIMCGGAMPGFDTTTTVTGTNTFTSTGPACTRAPLSLDDDEGDNNPGDLLSTSRTFASNTTTMAASKTSFSSASITKTSSISPLPSLGSMNKFGRWKVAISQYMVNEYSEVAWKLYDPNGNIAGEHNVYGNGMSEMKDSIEAVKRPIQHMMPFEVTMTVSEPRNVDKCRVHFEIKKSMPECDYAEGVGCAPFMTTEPFTEETPFTVSVCQEACDKKSKKPVLDPSDLWCQDLNDADWEPMANGWMRRFECGWKGF